MNRVWTYIISRELNPSELQQLQQMGEAFVKSWTAHEVQLHAEFSIFKNRIMLVKVNENIHEASGCSIDKLSHFVKQAEKQFNTELLNRLLVALKLDNKIQIVHSSKIKDMLLQGAINENTTVYNTALGHEDELNIWEQALKNTWLNKYLVTN
ncbi:MAG: hypothetical protein WCR21_08315 [Bacteroidota bacterium]